MNPTYDVIVVGGGASGLIAAGRAAELGKRVLLIEKNTKLGQKLRISGGGRCNITNADYDIRSLLKKYGKSEQFLYSLFSQFGVADTFDFFESRKLPLIVEARNRAFPASQNAHDVVQVLETYMQRGNVTVLRGTAVTSVKSNGNEIEAIVCGSEQYQATDYLFATGNVSHPETGSTGDGLEWLRKLGHTVAKPTPTIVPLAIQDPWVKALAGVTLRSMMMTIYMEGKKQFRLDGDVLFTHFGVSGPLILNSAHKIADLLYSGTVTATIDAFPHSTSGALEAQIVSVFDENKNKSLKNILKDIVPSGMQKGILLLVTEFMDPETKVHSVKKDDRKRFVQLLKALPLTIEGLMGFDRAVVADGGVELSEIDLKTMRSKKVKNLLITGDLLHITRPSGGYSLQLCWSSGYVAGSNAG